MRKALRHWKSKIHHPVQPMQQFMNQLRELVIIVIRLAPLMTTFRLVKPRFHVLKGNKSFIRLIIQSIFCVVIYLIQAEKQEKLGAWYWKTNEDKLTRLNQTAVILIHQSIVQTWQVSAKRPIVRNKVKLLENRWLDTVLTKWLR